MCAFLIGVLLALAQPEPQPCQSCHPAEVAGYAKSAMAHSIRKAERDPAGSVVNSSGTEIDAVSDAKGGSWQTLKRNGTSTTYRINYAIGSGHHATGYLVKLGDHLFQSPIAFYPGRRAYGLAPGYENLPNPDFTRPVSSDCLFCHADKPLAVAPGPVTTGAKADRYATAISGHEAISCERCHGPTAQHLLKPTPGSVVNPARLGRAARDSVCEQCHLSGAARILNPAENFQDFRAGEPLEKVFTVYVDAQANGAAALKVISHPEQLAASLCARQSKGALWCGSCHNPHEKPVDRVSYFRARCLTCHGGRLPQTHSNDSDCISCHMPRRETYDGAHTVFTDHRIARVATNPSPEPSANQLVVWRDAPSPLADRNLALAYLSVGIQRRSAAMIVRAYQTLTNLQETFAFDPALFNGIGTALLLGGKSDEARYAFERALQIRPGDAAAEENLARAYLASKDMEQAIVHLQKAVDEDPLALPAVELLEDLYSKTGESEKRSQLEKRVTRVLAQ